MSSLFQSEAEKMVDCGLERNPAALHLVTEKAGNIVIEGQSGSHIMMITTRHHDVNTIPANEKASSEELASFLTQQAPRPGWGCLPAGCRCVRVPA